jgi:hypothetical protein
VASILRRSEVKSSMSARAQQRCSRKRRDRAACR